MDPFLGDTSELEFVSDCCGARAKWDEGEELFCRWCFRNCDEVPNPNYGQSPPTQEKSK